MDEINAAIKGIGSTHVCDDAQLAVDNVNHYFGGKSLSDMAAAKVRTSEYSMSGGDHQAKKQSPAVTQLAVSHAAASGRK